MTHLEHLEAIDAAIDRAAAVMNLSDIDDLGETDPDAYEDIWEARFHCGTCIVRTVMEIVYPPIETYIKALKENDSHAALR